MAKTKNRIKKMNFQKKNRALELLEPLSEEHKYIIQMAGYKKEIGQQYEILPRTTGRGL